MKLLVLFCVLAACGGGGSKPPATKPPVATKVLVNVDDAGLALQGNDPVAYHSDGKPVPGVAEHTSSHGGATYRFASAEHKQRFDADPAKYAPRYGGYCAYAASQNRLSPVQVNQFEIYEGHLLLFTNADFKQRFDAEPAKTFQAADANWPGLVDKHGK